MYLDESIEDSHEGARHILTGPEARHASTVARLRVGETVLLGNGRGLVMHTTVDHLDRENVEVSVSHVERHDRRTPTLVLAQALAKTDRDERAVEAAVEVGVDAVVPWQAERSISRWDVTKAEKGRSRWRTIAREAAKQSLAPWVPHVEELHTTSQLVTRQHSRFVALDAGGMPIGSLPWREWAGHTQDIVLIVGPEGGFSDSDRGAFMGANAVFASLGPQVLRTSTAGPVALGIAAVAMGRWR